jgi:hypothetical protein
MMRLRLTITTVAVLFASSLTALAQPTNNPFVPLPPGSVVQNQGVAFNGEHANAHWRAVASKKLAGSGNGREFYQWYVSIYALSRGAYRLRYQSPGNGGPLSRVTQANGAKMWFPVQELRIVGTAHLKGPVFQQLVVQSHELGADCGSASVTVFATAPGGSVSPAVSVGNPCELRATIRRDGSGDSIELNGPYYAPNAALCCPTKPDASAVLRYGDGKWRVTPSYFKLE